MLAFCEAHFRSLIHELVDSILANANRLSSAFGWTRHFWKENLHTEQVSLPLDSLLWLEFPRLLNSSFRNFKSLMKKYPVQKYEHFKLEMVFLCSFKLFNDTDETSLGKNMNSY